MSSESLAYFLYSFGIIAREGTEAMLVVVALAAGTREGAHVGRARNVYVGAALAVISSIILAWAVNHIISDDASDTLEGIFQLSAAAVLLYVSSWLTSKAQAESWNRFIGHRASSAERFRVPGLALAMSAYLAVMREGAETIVFFQALRNGADAGIERHAILAGLAAGAVALAIGFYAITRAAMRIPMRAFMRSTSILLYALAVVFVGEGIASLQEADRIGATFVSHVPTIAALGIYPTVQSLGAQLALIALALAAYFAPKRRTQSKNLSATIPAMVQRREIR